MTREDAKPPPRQPPAWFAGAVDIHVHTAPSLFPRLLNDSDLTQLAAAYGMAAVVLKSHAGDTSGRAAIADAQVPALRVFGGVVLNRFVGGVNPHAVEASLTMGGRFVWFPTMHALSHIAHYGGAGYTEQAGDSQPQPVEPVRVLDAAGTLLPAVHDVLDVVAAHPGTVLVNGHLNADETLAVFTAARERGLERLVVSHPNLHLTNFNTDLQAQFANLGAIIEHCYLPHTDAWGGVAFEKTAADIRAVGAARCVLSTDLGQANQVAAPQGLLHFGEALLAAGLSVNEVQRMMVTNPAGLVGG
jgi:hypothetical protein